jgi:transcriptional regulator with XRE-family HTH domain
MPLLITPDQCRAARGLLGWSQQLLASRAQVARKTVADFEMRQVTPFERTLRDIVRAFDAAGVELIAEQEGVCGPGVRLKWKAPIAD